MNLEDIHGVFLSASSTAPALVTASHATTTFIVPDWNVIQNLLMLGIEHHLPNLLPGRYVASERMLAEIRSVTDRQHLKKALGWTVVDASNGRTDRQLIFGNSLYDLPPSITIPPAKKEPPSSTDVEIAVITRGLAGVGRSMSLSDDWYLQKLYRGYNWIENHGTAFFLARMVSGGIWTEEDGARAHQELLKAERYVGDLSVYYKALENEYGKRTEGKN